MLGTDSVLRVMKRSVGQPADAIASAAGFDSVRPKRRGSGAHSQPRVDPVTCTSRSPRSCTWATLAHERCDIKLRDAPRALGRR